MVRKYVKKRNTPPVSEEAIKLAVSAVLNRNMSIRIAARSYNIKKSTLHDRISKRKKQGSDVSDSGNESDQEEEKIDVLSQYATRQVFSIKEESELEIYLKQCSRILYGLTYLATRKLAYEYALKLQKNFPQQWHTNGMAGIEWIRSFMNRHPRLSLRKPENTSVARASAFNKHNVDVFFNNYEEVQTKYSFKPSRIWNTDETGISTVMQAPKVIAETGKRVVGQCVSAERGTTVTFCGTISATGNTIPPLYIYPRVRIKDYFLHGAAPGSVAFGTKSGWMTTAIFVKLLEHIKNHTHSSPESPILLLLDNHETHVSVDAINYARGNGIVLLSFPPHCTHRMQPLDKAVYGPFKQRCKVSFNDYLLSNPGKQITIYEVAKLTSEPFLQSFTPKNIINAFSSTGLWPMNRLIFTDDDFLGAYATDRPDPQGKENQETTRCLSVYDTPSTSSQISMTELDVPTTSKSSSPPLKNEDTEEITLMMRSLLNEIVNEVTRPSKITIFSNICIKPADIKPYPKAGARKSNKKSRLGKSRIYTSTPEKTRVEEMEANRKAKAKVTGTKKKISIDEGMDIKQDMSITKKKPRKRRPKEMDPSSSESDLEQELKKNKFETYSFDSDVEMEPSDVEDFTKLLGKEIF